LRPRIKTPQKEYEVLRDLTLNIRQITAAIFLFAISFGTADKKMVKCSGRKKKLHVPTPF